MDASRFKFRAWNKKHKFMDDDFFLHADGRIFDRAAITFDTPHTEIEPAEDFIIMQFTGLHDKNGKEIYEGDILHCGWDVGPTFGHQSFNVIFEEGEFRYDAVDGSGWMRWEDLFEPEIIGNIYKKPELLEGSCNSKS